MDGILKVRGESWDFTTRAEQKCLCPSTRGVQVSLDLGQKIQLIIIPEVRKSGDELLKLRAPQRQKPTK